MIWKLHLPNGSVNDWDANKPPDKVEQTEVAPPKLNSDHIIMDETWFCTKIFWLNRVVNEHAYYKE